MNKTKDLNDFKYAQKSNWKNPDYTYLKNVNIVEWDIKSAGLTVLKFRKLLPDDELRKLEKLPKKKRTIKEGLLQREKPEIAREIVSTLEKVRHAFTYSNSIYPENVISIKKDAIFLLNHKPYNTNIKGFEFRKKGEYTSYLKISNYEFYYNSIKDVLDIKGLSEEVNELQKEYFLKHIRRLLNISEKVDSASVFKVMERFRLQYLNRELPIETYRELSTGKFRVGKYLLDSIQEDMLSSVDISQNYLQFFIPMCDALL